MIGLLINTWVEGSRLHPSGFPYNLPLAKQRRRGCVIFDAGSHERKRRKVGDDQELTNEFGTVIEPDPDWHCSM